MSCPIGQSADVFPRTETTWIGSRLEHGPEGMDEVLRHVMNVYAKPLAIYLRGTPFQQLGEPDDLVAGFFASRLSRQGYLLRWRESERPLRRWLITGLRHFLLEEVKRRQREGRAPARGPVIDLASAGDATPSRQFDRAVARNLLADALRATEAGLAADGLHEHWHVFHQHHVDGRSFPDIAQSIGIEPQRLAVMARIARRRLRGVVRSMVGWPGITPDEVDQEIRDLLA